VHTSRVYKLCADISLNTSEMNGLNTSKMNIVNTSEMNVVDTSQMNIISLICALFLKSCIFNLII